MSTTGIVLFVALSMCITEVLFMLFLEYTHHTIIDDYTRPGKIPYDLWQ